VPNPVLPLAFPRLLARQKELGVSNDALAAKVNRHRGTISQIHRGRTVPSVGLRQLIADALDSTVDELFAPADEATS
jgi:transcriptional regulator with XRE-family HTH domain